MHSEIYSHSGRNAYIFSFGKMIYGSIGSFHNFLPKYLGLVGFFFALLAVLWSESCGHSMSRPFWKQDKILIEYYDAEFASWDMLISSLISLKILLLYSSYTEASQAFIKHIYVVMISKQSIHKTAILGEYCVHTWSFCEKCFLWKHKVIKGNEERDEHNSHRVYGKNCMAFLVTYIAFFSPGSHWIPLY